MTFRLSSPIISLHPYNGHIPRIFLYIHVISLIHCGCATAQMGPAASGSPLRVDPLRRALRRQLFLRRRGFTLSSADQTKTLAYFARSPLRCLRRPIFAFPRLPCRRPAEIGVLSARPWPCSSTYAVLSSHSFVDQTEGGAPNIVFRVLPWLHRGYEVLKPRMFFFIWCAMNSRSI